jgi:hypothetical protein
MTALTAARSLAERSGLTSTPPVAASTIIYQGAIVVMEGGVAKPGKTATGLVVIGVAEETVDNSGGAAGAKKATVRRGCYPFANLGADPVTAADIYQDVYLVDDQTIARTSGTSTRSVAGKLIDVDAVGAWVRIGA